MSSTAKVNIINFIRGIEPRMEMDLYAPVVGQLELLKKHQMQGTFLMQYDALLDGRFVSLLQDTPHEIGGWFEIVQPMAEAVGFLGVGDSLGIGTRMLVFRWGTPLRNAKN